MELEFLRKEVAKLKGQIEEVRASTPKGNSTASDGKGDSSSDESGEEDDVHELP